LGKWKRNRLFEIKFFTWQEIDVKYAHLFCNFTNYNLLAWLQLTRKVSVFDPFYAPKCNYHFGLKKLIFKFPVRFHSFNGRNMVWDTLSPLLCNFLLHFLYFPLPWIILKRLKCSHLCFLKFSNELCCFLTVSAF